MRNSEVMKNSQPTTLLEAVRYYSDLNVCVKLLAGIRWANGIVCPCCASKEITAFKTRQIWKCRTCKKQFSVKVGTIFEQSPLGLDKWFVAMWLIANAKNGISSCEIARALGITQKSAWFMLHRVRESLRNGSFEKMKGTVEADETYIGGLEKNKHISKSKFKNKGPQSGKTVVMGLLERDGKVVAKVVTDVRRGTLVPEVMNAVEPGSTLYTDALMSYRQLGTVYDHSFVDHGFEYVRGDVHTNGIEGYWSLLKRSLKGTYVSVEPFHLERYLDEQSFRFNNRKTNDSERFMLALMNVTGRRLTHEQLITLG